MTKPVLKELLVAAVSDESYVMSIMLMAVVKCTLHHVKLNAV
jgi:hypothetical protein